MASIAAQRPQFFEGQYLGADDLASMVEYLRTSNARQNLGQHSWGVAIGLDLVYEFISDSAVEYYVQPGVAIDGYGRIIVVSNPTRIEADQFAGIGSGNIDVWVRYDQSDFSATRNGFKVCSSTDEYSRITESFSIVVGNKSSILDRQSGVTVNENLLPDARNALVEVDSQARLLCDASVPHQAFPIDDEDAQWLVPLGHVKWSSSSSSFLPLVDPGEQEALEGGASAKTSDQVYESLIGSRTKRRLIGVVAESVLAADGLIRLRERTAEPDETNGNDSVCKGLRPQSRDLMYCDGRLTPKELVWLEGDTRIQGDARLLNGRLEFKDEEGRDYIDRTVEGVSVSSITPTLIQRTEGNSRNGVDLQVLLGKSDDGINRFTIGNVEFGGSDLCNVSITAENQVVIQDNGRLGIGTTSPDSLLESPYTVRGLKQTIVENEGTEEENSYDIYRLENYEGEDGVVQWQMDLWDTEGSDRKSLNITESGLADSRLFLQNGGNMGMGTTAPTERLHIFGNKPNLFLDNNGVSEVYRTQLKFGSEGSTHAGMYWINDPNKVFIHHEGVDSLVINEEKIGLGTTNPLTTLHIATGEDVDLSNNAGYLLLGDIDGLNVVIDDNEIQARDDGDPAQLHLQVEGGDFSVHWGDSTEFRIKDNGDVGIGTNNPTRKLDVRGDIRLGDNGNLFAMAGVENLRTIVGRVDLGGNPVQGNGYTSSNPGAGQYMINFNTSFSSSPVVVVSAYDEEEHIISVRNVTSGSFLVRSRDMFGSNAGDLQNAAFTFIAIGER